ncbi:MAG: IclR family transcriptional regulator C-terminal domain-containing protein [Pseudomonadota bacterium]|nr:IclR family transcriptional regulator C-terminal domain-containing protein [Pseudomonadota bacterium]
MPSDAPSPPAAEADAEPQGKGVAAVDRALSVLAAIEQAEEAPTLSDLSRATGLYKSTILRLLESLQGHGYVSRMQEARYALGPAVRRLGMAYERRNPLRDLIEPVMAELVEAGCESPSFHVRQDARLRLCLFRRESNHSTLDRVHAGDLLPLDRGAAGRVILACDGGETAPGGGVGGGGEGAAAIRAAGWALSLGERDPDCAGLAAPVYGPHRRLIGALSLSGPRERFSPDNIAAMRARLIPAAEALSKALGG